MVGFVARTFRLNVNVAPDDLGNFPGIYPQASPYFHVAHGVSWVAESRDGKKDIDLEIIEIAFGLLHTSLYVSLIL
jgi:hypothetical protein